MTNEEELLYNEIYKRTKDCGRAQFIKLLITERRNNRQLKGKLKATGKGLNKVLSKRKKWKDRYYEELRIRRNLEKWLEEENKKLMKIIKEELETNE